MRRLCIVHFQEIEKYPPTINLLRYLPENHSRDLNIEVLTTRGQAPEFQISPDIKIRRLAKWGRRTNKVARMMLYIRFNFLAIIRLIRFSPDAILYYETLSVWPPWFYKKFLRKDVEVYVHYHEYVTKYEYEEGMKLIKWLYEKEKQLLPQTCWVSHTNADRMELFLKDVAGHQPLATYIIPNYPPAAWKKKIGKRKEGKIGFVYVGALSLETMYLRQMAEYVKARQAECYWDIYSTNFSDDVLAFFRSNEGVNISFKGGISYDELPAILSQYHVGLILYKGHIPNYVYNIPNKLFEYHVCSLDVWFPTSMKSSLELVTKGSYPKICAIDFENLRSIDLKRAISRLGLIKLQHDYSCEQVFKLLDEKLTKADAAKSTTSGDVGIHSSGHSGFQGKKENGQIPFPKQNKKGKRPDDRW
jgi:hypothetical protein